MGAEPSIPSTSSFSSLPGISPSRSANSVDSSQLVTGSSAGGQRGSPVIPQRRIVGFHQDQEKQWVAELECGHSQHIRHTPPWQLRPWVLTEAGRIGHLGTGVPCPACADPEVRHAS